MGRRDREQARDRGNTDVVKDERGRGKDVGRAPHTPTRDRTEGRDKTEGRDRAEGRDKTEGRDRAEGRDKTEGDRDRVRDQPGADAAEDMGRSDDSSEGRRRHAARADRGTQPVQRHTVGLKNPSTTGGKIGRAADRRDDSGDPENP